jgi:hypothetical protein
MGQSISLWMSGRIQFTSEVSNGMKASTMMN